MKRHITIILIFLLSALLCVNLTPVYATQPCKASQNLEIALDTYLSERAAILNGHTSDFTIPVMQGITDDEILHKKLLKDKEYSYNSVSRIVNKITTIGSISDVLLQETVSFGNVAKAVETINHKIRVGFDEYGSIVILSDSYQEEHTGFSSASFVNLNANVKSRVRVSNKSVFTSIAEAEIGYYSPNNSTKYGIWYGMNPAPWCAMFVSWCANQAGINTSIIPKFAYCPTGASTFDNWGKFHYRSGYSPKVGDIYFTGTSISGALHTGIVTDVNNSYVTIVEGNYGNAVCENIYAKTDTSILGYGSPAHLYIYKYNDFEHWKECLVCGKKILRTSHSWVNYGTYYKCSVCGLTSTNPPGVSKAASSVA